MKIKTVCELTGLTDRAVRYYIEEGLTAPAHTENYLGRRNFDFTDEDVRRLLNVAALRRYGFSVAEIKTMLEEPGAIGDICAELISRKRDALNEDGTILSALEKLSDVKPKNVDELVSVLETPPAPPIDLYDNVSSPDYPLMPARSNELKYVDRLRRINVISVIAALLPITVVIILTALDLTEYRFPVLNAEFMPILLILLLPALFILSAAWFIKKAKAAYILRIFMTILCLLMLPAVFFCSFFIINDSVTDDLDHYLEFDKKGRLSAYVLVGRLFPSRADFFANSFDEHKYHYHDHDDMFGRYHDVTAEKRYKTRDEFDTEVERVKLLFDTYYADHAEDWRFYGGDQDPGGGYIALKYDEFGNGRFDCIALFTASAPFEENHDSRTVYMFACDPNSLTVRYIFYKCTDHNEKQPSYFETAW